MTDLTLKKRIQEDMKNALRAGEKQLLGVIRLILAAIKQREVDERIELDDTQVLVVLDKMLKERRDSLQQYQAANRQDLADQESFEIDTIQTYLPTPLSPAEIEQLIKNTIKDTAATSMKDMGKVMATLKPLIQGRADAAMVSAKVKELLS